MNVDIFIKKNKCKKEITELLNTWEESKIDKWHGLLGDDGLLYIKPTTMFAVWIQANILDNHLEFSKISPESITKVKFIRGCE